MSKLTLDVPEELVSIARDEAAARQVSLSELVSDFFSTLTKSDLDNEKSLDQLAPRTRRLAGCIPETAVDADREEYLGYLDRKHS